MRYLTCNEKGCGRTFEGTTALHIHLGKAHKANGANGTTTATVKPNGAIATPVTVNRVLALLLGLDKIAQAYVISRAVEAHDA